MSLFQLTSCSLSCLQWIYCSWLVLGATAYNFICHSSKKAKVSQRTVSGLQLANILVKIGVARGVLTDVSYFLTHLTIHKI